MIRRAIVTGGTGFIGSHLCKRLIDLNWQVSIIVRESSDYFNIKDFKEEINVYEHDGDLTNLIDFFRNENADVVFHLASLFISEHKLNQVDALVESNLKFGLNVLEAMKGSETKLMVNTGTSWQHYHTNGYDPVNLYAATKEAYEKLLKYYIEAEEVRAITLKLFDTYGETDKRPKLINLLNKFANEKKELKMSPGSQVIDLVHIDDVTNAFIIAYDYLIENEQIKYKEFGVGTGNPISLRELIHLFEDLTGKELNVVWGGREYRKREVMKLWSKYETLPDWECKVNLREGLLRYRDGN